MDMSTRSPKPSSRAVETEGPRMKRSSTVIYLIRRAMPRRPHPENVKSLHSSCASNFHVLLMRLAVRPPHDAFSMELALLLPLITLIILAPTFFPPHPTAKSIKSFSFGWIGCRDGFHSLTHLRDGITISQRKTWIWIREERKSSWWLSENIFLSMPHRGYEWTFVSHGAVFHKYYANRGIRF